MRLFLGLTLVALCLSLAGCGLTQRNRGNNSRASGNQPFMGLPETRTASADPSPPSSDTLTSKQGKTKERGGILAGSVIDSNRRRVAGATIQVVELDAPRDGAAPLSVMTNRDGWFDIGGLEVGRWYRLVARARDGTRYLTGSARVQCSNVRVAIALTSEEPIPPPAPPPSEPASKSEARSEAPEKAPAAAASIGAPIIPPPTDGSTTPLPGDEARPVPAPVRPAPATTPSFPPPVRTGPAPGIDPSLIAEDRGRSKDGFNRVPPPLVDIPGPGRDAPRKPMIPYSPPPPPMSNYDDVPPPSTAPSAAPIAAPPSPAERERSEVPSPPRAVVPSCVRSGQRVEDFALYDLNGEVWELSKNRRGKLALLDFWYTTCLPCRAALPFLAELDRKYRRFGLDVVGIAHEEGTFPEKQAAVRQARTQYGINYPLLFTGGGTGGCPVVRQLEVTNFPTVVLLDESGKIVGRYTGLAPRTKYDLEMAIRRHLGLPAR